MMPDLPRVSEKREATFGITFRAWLKINPRFSCAFELKETKTNSINFRCLEDHQVDYLLAIKGNKGVLVRVQGSNGEPDYIYLRNFPACVVIKFEKEFSILDIDTFLLEKKRSVRKSLTAERACALSTVTVKLR